MRKPVTSKLDIALNSDFIANFVQAQATLAARNIVPGSIRMVSQDCINTTFDTFRSQIPNRCSIRLGPIMGQATIMQNNDIRFVIEFPASSLGLQFAAMDATTYAQSVFAPLEMRDQNVTVACTQFPNTSQLFSFWIGYDTGATIANDSALSIETSNTKWNANGYFDVHALLSALGIPDSVSKSTPSVTNTESIYTLAEAGPGLIINIPYSEFANGGNVSGNTTFIINPGTATSDRPARTIQIEGLIDLSQCEPLFNYMPLMTDHYSNLFLNLTMQQFLRNLKVIYVPNDGKPLQKIPIDHAGICSINTAATGAATINKTMKVRLVNILNYADDAARRAVAALPSTSIISMSNAIFRAFETRQVCFDLEDYPIIDSMYRSQGEYTVCVQDLHSLPFQGDRNAYTNGRCAVTVDDKNIAAAYITFPYYDSLAPLFWPNPLISNIQLRVDNNTYPLNYDNYVDKAVQRRIHNCFVDTDEVSANVDLASSLSFKNKNISSFTPYGRTGVNTSADVDNIFSTNGIAINGTNYNYYMPNTFVYAQSFEEPGCFRKGVNSSYYGQPRSTINISFQADTSSGIQGSGDAAGIIDTRDKIANNIMYGDLLYQQVCPILTLKIDRLMTFYFVNGKLSDIVFN